jgi:predicted RNase H-like nuclease (RuvC/YqgF family)
LDVITQGIFSSQEVIKDLIEKVMKGEEQLASYFKQSEESTKAMICEKLENQEEKEREFRQCKEQLKYLQNQNVELMNKLEKLNESEKNLKNQLSQRKSQEI